MKNLYAILFAVCFLSALSSCKNCVKCKAPGKKQMFCGSSKYSESDQFLYQNGGTCDYPDDI